MKKSNNFEQISDNFIKGKLITDLNEIVKLASERESIYVVNWRRMSPASFILGMQFRQVNRWLEEGQFYNTIRINSKNVGNYFKDSEKDKTEYIRNIEVILETAGSKKSDLICSGCGWNLEKLVGNNCSREGCIRNRD